MLLVSLHYQSIRYSECGFEVNQKWWVKLGGLVQTFSLLTLRYNKCGRKIEKIEIYDLVLSLSQVVIKHDLSPFILHQINLLCNSYVNRQQILVLQEVNDDVISGPLSNRVREGLALLYNNMTWITD